jgi:hypothetical protein
MLWPGGPFPVKSAALLQNVIVVIQVAMQISTKVDAFIGPRVSEGD